MVDMRSASRVLALALLALAQHTGSTRHDNGLHPVGGSANMPHVPVHLERRVISFRPDERGKVPMIMTDPGLPPGYGSRPGEAMPRADRAPAYNLCTHDETWLGRYCSPAEDEVTSRTMIDECEHMLWGHPSAVILHGATATSLLNPSRHTVRRFVVCPIYWICEQRHQPDRAGRIRATCVLHRQIPDHQVLMNGLHDQGYIKGLGSFYIDVNRPLPTHANAAIGLSATADDGASSSASLTLPDFTVYVDPEVKWWDV